MLKIGIIGTGMGKFQAQVISKFEDSKVIAICGVDIEKTKRIAKELDIENYLNNYLELLKNDEIDLIIISTPNYLHFEMYKEALKSNKHIILEKPAGINSNEIEKMINLSKNYKKLIVVDHNFRFSPLIIKLKDLKNKFGDINYIDAKYFHNYYTDESYQFKWLNDHKAGGGQKLLVGTHMIDLCRYLLDYAELIDGKIFENTIIKSRLDNNQNQKNVTSEDIYSSVFKTLNNQIINTTSITRGFGYKGLELTICYKNSLVKFDEINGLRITFSNKEKLCNIDIIDTLPDINIEGSILSKSFKYLYKKVYDHINNIEKCNDFCTLEQAKQNLIYLEKFART